MAMQRPIFGNKDALEVLYNRCGPGAGRRDGLVHIPETRADSELISNVQVLSARYQVHVGLSRRWLPNSEDNPKSCFKNSLG
jgi:hypothetical protein